MRNDLFLERQDGHDGPSGQAERANNGLGACLRVTLQRRPSARAAIPRTAYAAAPTAPDTAVNQTNTSFRRRCNIIPTALPVASPPR